MNPLKGILLKILSAAILTLLNAQVRLLGDAFPVGEVIFFRSGAAVLVVLIIFAVSGRLMAAVRTNRPLGHIGRGAISTGAMYGSFASFVRMPLADATAIQFATPLLTVALASVILKEKVRIYRWSAISVGFLGVLVMLIPHFDAADRTAVQTTAMIGAAFAMFSVVCSACNQIQARRLTSSETTSSIVLYFSLFCTVAGGATLPFAWHTPTWGELCLLISLGVCGGVGHLLMTESFRLAPASVIAPFDYTAMIWALLYGYLLFGELPDVTVYAGCAVVVGAGLFVIWRERQLGMARNGATESSAAKS